MNVISFVSYFPRNRQRSKDRTALRFISAIKGETSSDELDAANSEQAVAWFSQLATLVLDLKRLPGPVILVPIPDSGCSQASGRTSHTLQLANAIAHRSKGCVVLDVLRWTRPMKPSHKGGGRNPQEFFDSLVVKGSLPAGRLVVVDDLVTKGSHVRAAAAKLSSSTRRCDYALCVGRTVGEQQETSFGIVETELRDFYPRLSSTPCSVSQYLNNHSLT